MKYCSSKIAKLFASVALFFCLQSVIAQSYSASPYSRYAFGDISGNPHSSFYGLGGLSVSLCDSFQFNSYNPASYSFLLKHRPVFDFGVGGQYIQMKNNSSQNDAMTFTLRAISLGIPVSAKWGLAFGITPVSSMGYSFVSHQSHPVIGDITYKYDGKGGVNRLYIGTSFMPVKKNNHRVSAGMNLSYLFGSLQTSSRAIYDNNSINTGYLHSKLQSNTFVSDFMIEGGVIYRGPINEEENAFLTFGSTINAGANLYAKNEKLSYVFNDQVSESLVDTVEYVESSGHVFFPKKLSFAASFEKRILHRDLQNAYRRIVISGQYDLQDWGKYSEIFAGDTVFDGMRNARTVSVGIQYSPFSSSIIGPDQKWWEISTYRLAFTSSNTFLQFDSLQLKQYGISFGIGIPLLNSLSFSILNIGLEAGKRGSLENGLIEETYFRLNLGLTISPHRNDLWFIKRKYD